MGNSSVNSGDDDLVASQHLAARLAAIADIRDVRLMKTAAEIFNLPASASYLVYELDSASAVEYEPGSASFVVRGTYKVSISASSSPDVGTPASELPEDVARIEFEQAALFTIDMQGHSPPEADELNAYAVSTGQFALYPYAREYIADMTMRLGLPPLTVGVLRVPALAGLDYRERPTGPSETDSESGGGSKPIALLSAADK